MSTQKSFIERSVQFEEENLATVEFQESSSSPQPLILSEETNKFLDFDMYDNDYLISYPNNPTIPKWEERTIHAAGKLAGNPSGSRRTRSQFESA